MIELKNISKIYESDVFRTEALKNINLKIEKGEFVSIMGDSGSGKSTLLRIMGGLDIPTDGEYWYMDTPLDFSNRKMMDAFRNQNIGYIFQNFELMERYTVYENIEMPLICRNIPKKETKRADTAYRQPLWNSGPFAKISFADIRRSTTTDSYRKNHCYEYACYSCGRTDRSAGL